MTIFKNIVKTIKIKKDYLVLILIALMFFSCNRMNEEVYMPESIIKEIEVSNNSIHNLINYGESNILDTYVEDAFHIDSSISVLLTKVNKDINITNGILNEFSFSDEIKVFLPEDFDKMPKDIKKVFLLNFKQKKLIEILELSFYSTNHFIAMSTKAHGKNDTIELGETFNAKIYQICTNFNDSVFIYINEKPEFIAIDSNGYFNLEIKDTVSGFKVCKGYFKNSLFNNSVNQNEFEIKYFVKNKD